VLEGAEMLGEIVRKIFDEGFCYSRDNTSTIDPEKSLYDFFQAKVKEYIPDGIDKEHQRNIVLQMSETWGGFVGMPITAQSLKFFWLEECVNGGKSSIMNHMTFLESILHEMLFIKLIYEPSENLFCASRFRNIIDYIARPAQEAKIIKLSTRVVSLDSADNIVKVTTSDGTVLNFDEVIVRSYPESDSYCHITLIMDLLTSELCR